MGTIKELREASGMSRKQFIDFFGIPYRTIQDWELGNRKCPEYLLELMKYKLEKEFLIVSKEVNCLCCGNSLSAPSKDGGDVLICFCCAGHEDREVVVAEDYCCPNFN